MRYISILSLLFIFFSCEFDYDIDKYIPPFEPQVVLSSTIAPHKPIKIQVGWSRHYSSIPDYSTVDSPFNVKIYEDDKLIINSKGNNRVLETDIYPKAGSTYFLELESLSYGKLTAQTYIPSKPYLAKVDSIKRVLSTDMNRYTYLHYEISKVDVTSQTRALWITDIRAIPSYVDPSRPSISYEHTNPVEAVSATNQYIDQINAKITQDDVKAKGSIIDHIDGFIRVPFKNLSKVFPINLSIQALISSGYNYLDSVNFSIVTPSDDYDRYYRDAFKHGVLASDKPDMLLFEEPGYVYTNINGGLGIFAGYIEEVKTIKYKKQSKK